MSIQTITVHDSTGAKATTLTREDYEYLKKSGMLWEFHPDAPFDWPLNETDIADKLTAECRRLADEAGVALPKIIQEMTDGITDEGHFGSSSQK